MRRRIVPSHDARVRSTENYNPNHTHTWRADGQVSAPTCTRAQVVTFLYRDMKK